MTKIDTRKSEDRERSKTHMAFLNGFPVAFAVAADEEEGWVEFLVMRDATYGFGKGPVLKPLGERGDDAFVTAKAYGTVVIAEWSKDTPVSLEETITGYDFENPRKVGDPVDLQKAYPTKNFNEVFDALERAAEGVVDDDDVPEEEFETRFGSLAVPGSFTGEKDL